MPTAAPDAEPSLFDHTNYRDYLRAVAARFGSRRALYAAFAAQGTPRIGRSSFLALLSEEARALTPPRLPADDVPLLAALLELSQEEQEYLSLLVEALESPSAVARETADAAAARMRLRERAFAVPTSAFATLFEDFWTPVLRELLILRAREGPQTAAELAAGLLGHGASPPDEAEVAARLERLAHAGLARRDGEKTRATRQEVVFDTEPTRPGARDPLRAYHEHALAQSLAALATLPPDQRTFFQLTLRLRPESVPEVNQRLRQLIDDLLALEARDGETASEVWTLGAQLWPAARSGPERPDPPGDG